MKGILFTEFLDFFEKKRDLVVLDDILCKVNFSHDGAYTSADNYSSTELVKMFICLSEYSREPLSDRLNQFGQYLAGIFTTKLPHFFSCASNTFELLKTVDNYIHVEVVKLYPDAAPPKFNSNKIDSTTLQLVYKSKRNLADLAEGIIIGCSNYYNESMTIIRQSRNKEDLNTAHFILSLNSHG